MNRLLLTLLFAVLPVVGFAKGGDGVINHTVAPVTLDPTKAYLLFRSSTAKSGMINIEHVFLRVPADAEVAAYRSAKEAAYVKDLPNLTKRAKDGNVPTIDKYAFVYDGPVNAFAVDGGDFLEDGALRTFLIEVPAGTYILYGTSVGGRIITVCNCLGTVKFAARPGVITEMGSLFADKVHKESPIPHLEDNLGASMSAHSFIIGQALVPPTETPTRPPALSAFPMETADYHAVGLFPEPGAEWINRLAPVPGILGYERGRVIDLRTGKPAE
jgi:hypothetical protein